MKFKNSIVAAIIVASALALVPTAANAVGYVPDANISVGGTREPGGSAVVTFTDTSFNGGEAVEYSTSGDFSPAIAMLSVSTVSGSKRASSTGSLVLTIDIPADATGTISLVATGVESGNIGTATITVAPVSGSVGSGAPGGLPDTGTGVPILPMSIGLGMLLLGGASLYLLRRRREQPRRHRVG